MTAVVSVLLIVAGLMLALVLPASRDARLYGLVLVVVGVLGLLVWRWSAGQRDGRSPPRGR